MLKPGAALYLAAGMLLFGSATPVSKIAGGSFSPFMAAGLRVLTGALLLLPFLSGFKSEPLRFTRREMLKMALLAVFGVSGFSLLLIFGMNRISGVTGSILLSLAPVATAIASVIFLQEKLSFLRTAGIVLATGGVIVISLYEPQGPDRLSGLLFLTGAVLTEALYTLLGKSLSKKINPVRVAAISGVLGALLFIPFLVAEINKINWGQISTEAWFAVLWWGAGAMGLGSVLWYKGVKEAEGSVAAGYMGLMPVSGLLLSYWLLEEEFKWLHLAGFAVVTTGVMITASTAGKTKE